MSNPLTPERRAELRRIARHIPDPAMAHSEHWLNTDLATVWHSLPALLDEADRLREELRLARQAFDEIKGVCGNWAAQLYSPGPSDLFRLTAVLRNAAAACDAALAKHKETT